MRSFETSITVYQLTRRNNPEELNLQQDSREDLNAHNRERLKSQNDAYL